MLIMSNRFVATDELISDTFNEDLKLVRLALQTFEEHGMIEITDNNAIQISNWEEYQSAERLAIIKEYERERKAKSREKQKSLPQKDNVRDNVRDMSTDSSVSLSNNINSNNTDISILVNNIINKYPNKSSISTGQKKLIDILMNAVDSEGLVNDISIAVDLYLEEHRKKNPDDTSYRYVHNFSKFLEEDMPYWLTQVGKKEIEVTREPEKGGRQ